MQPRDLWHPASADAMQMCLHPWRVWLPMLVRYRILVNEVLPISGLCLLMAEAAASDPAITNEQQLEVQRAARWVVAKDAPQPSNLADADLKAAFAYAVQLPPKQEDEQKERCKPLAQHLVGAFLLCMCCFALLLSSVHRS